ncbi:hypothetical protein COL10_03515 [Bacillus cereus]|nr:hypothetical protein CON46_11415 [Bacillus cereus]PFD76523.1 hypothetical protein CN301_05315 [Bacillus cereus]PFV14071.1 hypothetical protein COL10_03515 [Bacillus cereus]PGV45893.1 hypothetical protein COD74_10960 [Bacillus cereus]
MHFFSDEEPININFFNELPDTCPVCSFSISPAYILTYLKNDFTRELLCGCPRNECRALFFAVYQGDNYASYLVNCYPYGKVIKEFPQEVADLSPNFVAIFNQAHHAEQEGLDLICGVAYRKALEYLIKDFVIELNSDKTEEIKSMPLQKCIQSYIGEADIKEMAERAVWLGNDETHYVRKWENKDLQDLKHLIDLTVFFISMKLKAKRYRGEMATGKK